MFLKAVRYEFGNTSFFLLFIIPGLYCNKLVCGSVSYKLGTNRCVKTAKSAVSLIDFASS